ncbi:hypothetical protein [Amycolatopsis sp. cg9]|uniref:hypothetical protein n=1 Tax=Amycolatopsis sp. cg9 TaxID=3238801 RepID=UPI003524FE3C
MSFEHLGWDPAPGDPEQVRGTAKGFLAISDRAEHARDELREIRNGQADEVWAGLGAEAFGRSVIELCSDLDRLSESYREAGDALMIYADELVQNQLDAQQAERSAAAAAADAELFRRNLADAQRRSADSGRQATSAQTRLVFTRQRLVVSQTAADAAGTADAQHHIQQDEQVKRQAIAAKGQADGDAKYASTQLDLADERLDAARRTGSRVQALHQDAGNTAAEAVDRAAEVAHSYHRNPLETAWHGFQALVTSTEFDEFLTWMSDCSSMLTQIAPLVGLVPGAGEIAAGMYGAGLVLGGIAVVGRGLQTAADHSKAPKLVDAGVALGIASLGAVGKAGLTAKGTETVSSVHDAENLVDHVRLFDAPGGNFVTRAYHLTGAAVQADELANTGSDVTGSIDKVRRDIDGDWYGPEPSTSERIGELGTFGWKSLETLVEVKR